MGGETMEDAAVTAEEHLEEVRRLATARLKACALAAKHERLSLVDADRLAALERLVTALAEIAPTARMTRDYKDVLAADPSDRYTGKRWLFHRWGMAAVFDALQAVKATPDLPVGWRVDD